MAKNERILRIYPFLPPLPGGMEKHVLRLTEEQRYLNCDVTVAFNQGQATSLSDIQILPWLNLRRIKPQALRDIIFYISLIANIAFNGRRYDIVHVHGDWSAFLFGQLIARISGSKKHVCSLHGIARRGVWRVLYRIVLSGYTMVYSTGRQDAEYLDGLSKGTVRWQHSGIDSVFFNKDDICERHFDVISVGSFLPVKNFNLIVEIAQILPGVSFLLVGDGPQKSIIEARCRDRGISNITFLGHLSPSEVSKQMKQSRIFLLTSFSEGTPTVLLEAMASGLAVITSGSNDYEDLIKPGQNGYVIEGFQADFYAQKIDQLLNNSSMLTEISCRNREQATCFGWPEVAKRITDWSRI